MTKLRLGPKTLRLGTRLRMEKPGPSSHQSFLPLLLEEGYNGKYGIHVESPSRIWDFHEALQGNYINICVPLNHNVPWVPEESW